MSVVFCPDIRRSKPISVARLLVRYRILCGSISYWSPTKLKVKGLEPVVSNSGHSCGQRILIDVPNHEGLHYFYMHILVG